MTQKAKKITALELKNAGASSFVVIDVRSSRSFASFHLAGSVRLETEDEILSFLHARPPSKPILFVCFSDKKSRQIAENFAAILQSVRTHWLEGGIMALETDDFDFAQTKAQNKTGFIPPPLRQKRLKHVS